MLLRHCHQLTNYYNSSDGFLSITDTNNQKTSERAGRAGASDAAAEPVLNVSCEAHYNLLDADSRSDNPQKCVDFAHHWYIYNEVFAQDLVAVIESDVDRHYIAIRENICRSLSLYAHDNIILLEDD